MIAVVAVHSFGKWLKSARQASTDPLTDRPYTQARLGELMDISPSKVAAWEAGEIASIAPEDANRLAIILQRSVSEILEALGYEVGDPSLTADERELLAAFRRLRASPALQDTALRVVRALPPQPASRPRRSQPKAAEGREKYEA